METKKEFIKKNSSETAGIVAEISKTKSRKKQRIMIELEYIVR